MTSIVINPYRGATSRISPTATAFPHRGPGYSVVILSQWADPADNDTNIAWTRATFDALRPHTADRVYVNNLPADDASFVPTAYGPNRARLVELKQRYDPDNVFHLNHNIHPRSGADGTARPPNGPLFEHVEEPSSESSPQQSGWH